MRTGNYKEENQDWQIYFKNFLNKLRISGAICMKISQQKEQLLIFHEVRGRKQQRKCALLEYTYGGKLKKISSNMSLGTISFLPI